jgi:prolyl-tRNA synthetase
VKVHIDERDVRPGAKYYDWELKGVPLRLELGLRDMEKSKVTFVRRDTGAKSLHDRQNASKEVRSMLELIQLEMLARAQKEMDDGTVTVDSLDKLPEKMLRMGWCGEERCGKDIETRSGRNILGIPIENEHFDGKCISCGRPTKMPMYIARAM